MQIESTLYRLEVSKNQAFWDIVDSPLYTRRIQDSTTIYATKDLIESVNAVYRNNDDLENIHVYFSFFDTFYSAVSTHDRERVKQKLIKELMTHNLGTHYEVTIDPDGNKLQSIDFFTCAQVLSKQKEKAIGIEMVLKGKSVYEALDAIDLGAMQKIYILNSEDRFIYDQGCYYTGQLLAQVADQLPVHYGAGTHVDFTGNKIVVSYQMKQIDWNLLVTFDYLSLFWQMAGNTIVMLLVLCGFAVIVLVAIAITKSNQLAAPINEIVNHLERYPGDGNAILEIPGIKGDIAVLVESYNRLIYKIEALHQLHLNEEKARLDAEYKALLTQINPHFLFNSLESMRGSALRHQLPELSATINALSLMLRYSLDPPNRKVTLSDELENLDHYLTVVRSCINYEIDVQRDIQPDTLNCHIVRFLFQPIVENTVQYGFGDNKRHRNVIWVKVSKQENRLCAEVRDNGKGCGAEVAQQLNEAFASGGEYNSFADARGTGIGLCNIAKRLRYAFGAESTLHIESPAEGGVVVTATVHYNIAPTDVSEP